MYKKAAAYMAIILTIVACELGNANGYVPTNEEIKQVKVGVDNKDTIQTQFGRPAIIGETGQKWYYVAQYRKAIGPLPLTESERRGLILHFNSNNVVTNVETFGLEDARDVPVSNYETESGGRELTFWDQFKGSLGNFSAENLLGGE